MQKNIIIEISGIFDRKKDSDEDDLLNKSNYYFDLIFHLQT